VDIINNATFIVQGYIPETLAAEVGRHGQAQGGRHLLDVGDKGVGAPGKALRIMPHDLHEGGGWQFEGSSHRGRVAPQGIGIGPGQSGGKAHGGGGLVAGQTKDFANCFGGGRQMAKGENASRNAAVMVMNFLILKGNSL
jgi:hypothetical protein